MSSSNFTFSSSEKVNFRELKKELRDVNKIGNENRDVQGWAMEMRLWTLLQNVTDTKLIYYGCLLTSQGDAQRYIQDLKENNTEFKNVENIEDNSEESSASDQSEEEDKEEEKDGTYPSLEKIIVSLRHFYGIAEEQNLILRKIRNLKIKRNETIKDFNIRYRNLYSRLNKNKKKVITVLDYIDSIQPNYEAWKMLSLRGEDISLEKAFLIAEKVDRLNSLQIPLLRMDRNTRGPSSSSPTKER